MADRSLWTPLHAQLHRTLLMRQLLERNGRILVAVSGGQDSLCLAKLLLDLQPKWGWQLAIAHCDHRWRTDSSANADYVEQLANTWQLPFYRQIAASPSVSEAAARQWRYQALTAIAIELDYQYIVTGHTKSDRVETLLFNLIRGTGADGLQALTWKRPLAKSESVELVGLSDELKDSSHSTLNPKHSTLLLVRPLLDITRTQTGQFCQASGLTVWFDSTNLDLKYSRNRIRHELLPYLATHFNPKVEQAIARTAELLRADVEYLELTARTLLQQALSQNVPNVNSQSEKITIGVNRLVLRTAPLAIQRRAMRQFLVQTITRAPGNEQIEKLTALITAPNRTRTDPFPGGAIAIVSGEWIWLKQSSEQ